jgi:hypothetical protein
MSDNKPKEQLGTCARHDAQHKKELTCSDWRPLLVPDNKPMTPEEFADQIYSWIWDSPRDVTSQEHLKIIIEARDEMRDEAIRREAKLASYNQGYLAGIDSVCRTEQVEIDKLIRAAKREMREACLRAAKRGFNSKSDQTRKQGVYDRINALPIDTPPAAVKEEWRCETCNSTYAEYVNGCPHCWEAGIRSKVSQNPAAAEAVCPRCDGSRTVYSLEYDMICPDCHGTGKRAPTADGGNRGDHEG